MCRSALCTGEPASSVGTIQLSRLLHVCQALMFEVAASLSGSKAAAGKATVPQVWDLANPIWTPGEP